MEELHPSGIAMRSKKEAPNALMTHENSSCQATCSYSGNDEIAQIERAGGHQPSVGRFSDEKNADVLPLLEQGAVMQMERRSLQRVEPFQLSMKSSRLVQDGALQSKSREV